MSSKDVVSLIEDDPDDDIQFLGFQRVDLARSATHTRELEEDGIVYAGFHKKGQTKRVCTGRHKLEPKKAEPEVIEISDDEDDHCPPPPQPAAATVNPSKDSQTKNTAVAHSSDDGTKQVSRSTVAVSANKRSSPPLILPGPPPKRSKPDDHKRNNSSASVAKILLPFKCISSSSTAPMQDVIKLEDVDDVPPSEELKREQSLSTTSFLSASIQSELHHKTTEHSDQLNSHDYMDTEEDSAYNSDDEYAILFHALNIDCSHNVMESIIENPLSVFNSFEGFNFPIGRIQYCNDKLRWAVTHLPQVRKGTDRQSSLDDSLSGTICECTKTLATDRADQFDVMTSSQPFAIGNLP
ncbi:hypothetical protein WOLCODRAFT_147637 [Wolfiporia cocos MD-104 SS10]|uniref:Uncharacterized protein n=1 Tax=Wolfiporia cocos (strain MD-104) TaxID=742152 RepID=A0A2H3IVU9_WOLCO|nr:hypothetical protein WOLCODRAFT_147637 [Wolfiporia cocos MD-104 SS10]